MSRFKYSDKKTNPPIWASQNFLTSKKTIHRLVRKTSINSKDHVIEIGPGKGHITGILTQHCQKVSAVEIDRDLYNGLREKYGESHKVRLYHWDFLKWPLPASGEYKVFANIPFSCTTSILRKLTEFKNPPQEAWLIMEKGAAKRFMGLPSENLRSLMIKPLFDMKISYFFSREDFHPMPGVDVVMIHLKRKPFRDIPAAQWRDYQNFISAGFMGNGTGLLRLFTKGQLSKARKIAGINELASGETLYIQWLCLFRCLQGVKTSSNNPPHRR